MDDRELIKKISALDINTALDEQYRLELHREMLKVFSNRQKRSRLNMILSRMITRRYLFRFSAAAVIIIPLLLFFTFFYGSGPDPIRILSNASAAEHQLFLRGGITHILNQINIYPVAVKKLKDSKDIRQVYDSWFEYNWLPICSVGPDGELRFNQLKLNGNINKAYSIMDESWYDSDSGCFARILKTKDKVLFANSFNGKTIYTTEYQGHSLKMIEEPVTEDFNRPQRPEQFLGITAGLSTDFEAGASLIQKVDNSVLDDGTRIHVLKIGFKNPDGQMNSYWIFKIRKDSGIIAEIEFVVKDRVQMLIKRIVSETADTPGISWKLQELSLDNTAESVVQVEPGLIVPLVSLEHMVENSTYQTYVFSRTHSWWAEPMRTTDCVDPLSPGHRMFIAATNGNDGRDIVLVQSETFNGMLEQFTKTSSLIYNSPNGFKVFSGGPAEWYSEVLLSSARIITKQSPSKDRVGFILESPDNRFLAIAINGPVTDKELHALVDSIVPTERLLKNDK